MRSRVAASLAAFACVATSANAALTLNVSSATDNTTFSLAGDANSRQGLSQLSVLDSGGAAPDVVSAMVDAQIRYASIAAADNGNGNNALDSARVNSDYSVLFSVTAVAGSQYIIDIDTALRGALTLFDDYSIGNGTSGQATVSNVAGSLGGVGNPNLSLTSATNSPNGTSGSSNTPLSFSNTLNLGPIVGTGAAQNFLLRFVFDTFAVSNGTSSTFDNADEAAARLGLSATITGGGGTFVTGGNTISADDYPGQGARVQSDDGHFVTFKVTYVAIPEAGSIAMVGGGLVAVAGVLVRRRKSSK